jgi:DnaD/phage-associated family protein
MVNSRFSSPGLKVFFTQVIPKIQDIAELKVVLYVLYLSHYECAAKPQRTEFATSLQSFVTYKELKAISCQPSVGMDEETLHQALNSAINHGTLLHSTLNIDGKCEDVYLLKTESCQPSAVNIFALYEQNVGIITPMIAEELKEAERLYPAQWIEEAFKEAVVVNKRSWKYIARILERWASEGRESGEHRQSIKKGSPDKYIKGKYGHVVKR